MGAREGRGRETYTCLSWWAACVGLRQLGSCGASPREVWLHDPPSSWGLTSSTCLSDGIFFSLTGGSHVRSVSSFLSIYYAFSSSVDL